MLTPTEARYSAVEKAALAVIIAARKLRPYFDSHPVQVMTNLPLEKALQNFDASGRLLKWAIELSQFDITFKPRPTVKAQALVEFLVEVQGMGRQPASKDVWEIQVDGSSAHHGSGAGILIIAPDGTEIKHAIRFAFSATNNEAEYEATVAGLQLAMAAGAERIKLQTDSQLVAQQVKGEREVREPSMVRYK